MKNAIKVLDYGYVRFVEAWGHGDAGVGETADGINVPIGWGDTPPDMECGIIEAARQSTQASFRGWEDQPCLICKCAGDVEILQGFEDNDTKAACPKCDGKGYLPGDKRLLAYLFNGKPQHATPFEFAGMVIEVQAPIFVFREWHRHRTFSFNEMSARYAPLPNLNYLPTPDRCLIVSGMNKQAGAVKGSDQITHESALEWLAKQAELYELVEAHYQDGLRRGIPKEVARIGLPVGRYSRMRAQTNLRNWLAFLTLRADPKAQWEIQQFAHAVGTIIAEQFPRTWRLYVERKAAT